MRRRTIFSLTLKDWAWLATRYRRGHSITELARKTGLTPKSVKRFMQFYGFRRAGSKIKRQLEMKFLV